MIGDGTLLRLGGDRLWIGIELEAWVPMWEAAIREHQLVELRGSVGRIVINPKWIIMAERAPIRLDEAEALVLG